MGFNMEICGLAIGKLNIDRKNLHVKIHVNEQEVWNLTSDWLAAQSLANKKPC